MRFSDTNETGHQGGSSEQCRNGGLAGTREKLEDGRGRAAIKNSKKLGGATKREKFEQKAGH